MGTLTSRSDKSRIVVVSVLGLLAFVVMGLFFHEVLRSTIQGVITIGLLILFLPASAEKKFDGESNKQ
jgi:hypothetical protein